MFSYRYMSMQMRDNLAGTRKISDEVIYRDYLMSPQNMTMNMHMVMAMYGISNRLSVMAMFNYNSMNMSMSMPIGNTHMHMAGMSMSSNTGMSMSASGIGDTRLYAVYALLNKPAHLLMLSAGINLPTGSITQKGDAASMVPGQRFPYMMQLGSGTYDIMPGITYVLRSNKISWGSQLAGVIRPGYNSLNYSYGNELSAGTWLAYKFLPWLSTSVRAEAIATESIYGKDNDLYEIIEPDSKAANYGGTRINSYLGINVFLKNFVNSKFSFEYGLPVYQNLNGPQLASRSILYAGWGVSF